MTNPNPPKRRTTFMEPDWATQTKTDNERWYGPTATGEYEKHMGALDRLNNTLDDDDRNKYGTGFSA